MAISVLYADLWITEDQLQQKESYRTKKGKKENYDHDCSRVPTVLSKSQISWLLQYYTPLISWPQNESKGLLSIDLPKLQQYFLHNAKVKKHFSSISFMYVRNEIIILKLLCMNHHIQFIQQRAQPLFWVQCILQQLLHSFLT